MSELTNELLSASWVLAALVCVVASMWFVAKFFRKDRAGVSGKRFRDALIGTVLLGMAVVCGVLAVSHYQYGPAGMTMLPVGLCLGVLSLPIGVAGMYWRSYQCDLFARYPNVVGTPPPSARLSDSKQSVASGLPGPAERAGVAVLSWALGAIALGAIVYLVADPGTRSIAVVFAPVFVLVAFVTFVGPVIWLWIIRKRESGL